MIHFYSFLPEKGIDELHYEQVYPKMFSSFSADCHFRNPIYLIKTCDQSVQYDMVHKIYEI